MLMWVPGSVAYLVPLFVIGVRLLFGVLRDALASDDDPLRVRHRPGARSPRSLDRCRSSAAAASGEAAAFDLLRFRSLGRFLRWRHAPALLAGPAARARRAYRLRWLSRTAGRRHESGGRTPLDSLARTGGPGLARGRQRLLHGLPVHAAADAGPALATARAVAWPPWLRNKWLAVAPRRWLLVGLRGVCSLGQPLADRLDHSGVISRLPSSSTVFFAARRSANMSARSVSSISCNR